MYDIERVGVCPWTAQRRAYLFFLGLLLLHTVCSLYIPVLWTLCHDRWTGSNVFFVTVGGKYPEAEFDVNGSRDSVLEEEDSG